MPKRIAVIGSAGSGKSTLSRQLGRILGIRVIHLDSVFWKPGWQQSGREEFRSKVEELVRDEEWIIDGNYGSSMDCRLQSADMVIFLDVPRLLCIYRVIKRYLTYRGRSRPDLTEGCPEKLDFEFISWIWSYAVRSRPVVMERLKCLKPGQKVFTFKTPGQVKKFLSEMERVRFET